MKKKLQTWLIVAVALVLALVTAKGITVSAAETVKSGTCGEQVTWTLDDSGVLTISGTGDMDYWLFPSTLPWASERKSIQKIEVGPDVTSIGSFAFYGCSNLQEVSLPEGLTRVESYAFAFCTSLTEITLPDKLEIVGTCAFDGCSSLMGITLPSAMSRVNDYAFYGCSALSDVKMPDSIQIIGKYAFASCSSLSDVTVPDSVVKLDDYGFAWCGSLKAITIPKDMPEIGSNVFFGCSDELVVYYSGDAGTASPSELSDLTGAETSNSGKQDYSVWASTINSYLVVNEDSTLTRVEFTGRDVTVEQYTTEGKLLKRQFLDMELPLFGGFYAGSDYYFLVFGQTNREENDKQEVIRVVKYSKSWEKLGSAGLYGANTTVPFDAGSLRMAQSGDMLYIRTSHEMYKSEDGSNHQANLTFSVKISTMDITDQVTGISSSGLGYVSHSFNQFILVNGSELVTVDHGDAYPRAVVLMKYAKAAGEETFVSGCSSINVLPIKGGTGQNYTGVSVGGLEASESSYLVAGNSVAQDSDYDPLGVRNIFVASTPVNNFSADATTLSWITSYSGKEEVSTPHLVKISNSRFLLMWTVDGVLNYVFLKDTGEMDGEIYTSTVGTLSDCQPVFSDGKVIWYSTSADEPLYFSIDPDIPAQVKILNQTHRVTFCPMGGSMETDSKTVIYGSAYGTLPEPVKDGYVFLGWYTSVKDGNWIKEDTIVTSAGNEKLYAQWLEKASCGDNLSWSVKDGVLTISGTGKMYNWENIINTPWYPCRKVFDEIVIEEGVEDIGAGAFGYLDGLVKVTIADSVTIINNKAFFRCSKLQNIKLPDGVTTIGNMAFGDCSSLISMTIPSGVTGISTQLFDGCSQLTSVTLPEGLTSIAAYAFDGCSSLENINLPDGVNSIGSCAFANCSSLKNVILPEELTSVGGSIFEGCTGLEKITIGYQVTSISDTAFDGHSDQMVIAGYEGSIAEAYAKNNSIQFEAISYQFSGTCGENLTWTLADGVLTIRGEGAMPNWESQSDSVWYRYRILLEQIVIEDGITNVGDYAFYGASRLISITFPDSMEKVGQCAFRSCSSIETIVFPKGVTSLPYSVMEECSSLRSVVFQGDVTSIGAFAFYRCSSLSDIVLPDSLEEIGFYAFSYCSSLKSIVIPDLITSIGYATFYGCSSLEEITIPFTVGTITDKALDKVSEELVIYGYEGSAAEKYAEQKGITFHALSYELAGSCGENLTWSLQNGVLTVSGQGAMTDVAQAGAPWYSYRLMIGAVVLENGVTSVGTHAFSGCISLRTVTLPDSIESIGMFAFRGCSSLESLEIPEGITEVPAYMLDGCTSIKNVTLPDSIDSIGSYAFRSCGCLSTLAIPESVSSMGTYAFYDCSSLSAFVIPEGVAEIGSNTFGGCTGLKEITIPSTVISISDTAFSGCSDFIIYGYEGSVAETFADSNGITFVALSHIDTGSCGESLTWRLINGTLVISGEGAMTDWSENTAPWYAHISQIEKVIVESGVTGIGSYAFAGCDSMTEITIPDTITAMGDYAFYGCADLADVTLPKGITKISSGLFADCSGLCSITFGDEVTEIGENAFQNCIQINDITLPESMNRIGSNAFYNCIFLQKITIPYAVTVIGEGAFSNCSSDLVIYGYANTVAEEYAGENDIKFISLSGYAGSCGENLAWNLKDGVLTIGGQGDMTDWGGFDAPWYSCENMIKEVVIEKGVTSIGKDAFSFCSVIEKVTMADTVTVIGNNAFYNCSSLDYVEMSNGITSIGNNAFYGCSSLGNIELAENVSSIGSMAFYKCSTLSSIEVPFGVNQIGSGVFAGCSGLNQVCLPMTVTSIADTAFADRSDSLVIQCAKNTVAEEYAQNKGIETDIVPYTYTGFCGEKVRWNLKDGILTIKGTGRMTDASSSSGGEWSAYKDGIVGVVVEEGITYIGKYAFSGDSRLRSIELSSGLAEIGTFAFNGCSSLTDVEFPTGLTTVGDSAFIGCKGLESVKFPADLTVIGDTAFYNCTGLTEVSFGGDMPSISKFTFSGVTANGYYPAGNQSWEGVQTKWGSGTFSWSEYYLANGTCGDGLTWTLDFAGVLTISGEGAMDSYESQESVPWHDYRDRICSIDMGGEITSIGNYAFSGCEKLTEITIPASVTSIGEGAFSGCINLKEITFEGSRPFFGSGVFENVTAEVYYPATDASWGDSSENDLGGSLIWYDHVHVVIAGEGAAATCTQAGITAGSYCSICGKVFEEQEEIPSFGHNWEDGSCTRCGEVEPGAEPTPGTTATPGATTTPGATAAPEETETPVPGVTATPEETETPVPGVTTTPGTTATPEETETPVPEVTTTPGTTATPEKTETPVPGVTTTPGTTATPEVTTTPVATATPGTTTTPGVTATPEATAMPGTTTTPGTTATPVVTETPIPGETGTPETTTTPEVTTIPESTATPGTTETPNPGTTEMPDITATPEVTTTPGTVPTPSNPSGAVCIHQWGEWEAQSDASVFAAEVQEHICSVCGAVETREYGSAKAPYITLPSDSLKMQINQSTTRFQVLGMEEGDYVVSVTSDNTKILKVSDVKPDGTFKLKAQKKTGTVKLTITLASGLTKTVQVKVQRGKVKTSRIAVASTTVSLAKGKKMALKPFITPVTSQQKLTYTSSSKKIAAVTSKGVITAKKEGTAKITVTSGKKKITITVRVTK